MNFVRVLCLIFIMVFFISTPAREPKPSTHQPMKNVQEIRTTDGTFSVSNLNNWAYYLRRDGCSACFYLSSSGGGIFPRRTANVIFTDGIVWGGFVMQPDADSPDTTLTQITQ
ncbi:MAG: hypothetical protein GXO78_11780 [Calditrichaeota bacterium]|nr:hypothetical protein [Calditrichota bacterium]